jgi:hypothetical protein
MTEIRKVGLLVGGEYSFPPAFIEEVNRRELGVRAELVKLGGVGMDDVVPYTVIIDRISHRMPFYRSYLKHAVLEGITVVNNPFMWSASDKFFGASLAARLGISTPRTVLLPHREAPTGFEDEESRHNLEQPVDWAAIVAKVGLPCVLKDAFGSGWRDVYVCRSRQELVARYEESGDRLMMAQEHIAWEHFVRCICMGHDEILPIPYDPLERRYLVGEPPLPGDIEARLLADSRTLVHALGYEVNSIEWAIRDGIPYVIDFMDPAPDMDIDALTPHYFDRVVKGMANLAVALATNPHPQHPELRWAGFLAGRHRHGERLTGASDLDGAGDLAEELPSLARGLPRTNL